MLILPKYYFNEICPVASVFRCPTLLKCRTSFNITSPKPSPKERAYLLPLSISIGEGAGGLR
jgi:hypothetical protein